jgi:hypothetical protein
MGYSQKPLQSVVEKKRAGAKRGGGRGRDDRGKVVAHTSNRDKTTAHASMLWGTVAPGLVVGLDQYLLPCIVDPVS